MVKDYYTADEVAEILDMYVCSAQELIDGIIDFEPDELLELARAKGLTVDMLIR